MKVFVCILDSEGGAQESSIFVFQQKAQADLWQKIWKRSFEDDTPIVKEVEIEDPWHKILDD